MPVELNSPQITEEKHPYILLRGTHDAMNDQNVRVRYSAGEVVMLTSRQAHAFRDKFKSEIEFEAEQEVTAKIREATERALAEAEAKKVGKAPAPKATVPTVPPKATVKA